MVSETATTTAGRMKRVVLMIKHTSTLALEFYISHHYLIETNLYHTENVLVINWAVHYIDSLKPVTHDLTSWMKTVECDNLDGKSCRVSYHTILVVWKLME